MSKVEWKKLVLVSDVLYGYPFESSLFSEDSSFMPLIRIRDVKPAKASTYYTGEFNETYRIRKGDILVGMDGEFNIGKWDDRDGLLNQRVLKIKGKEDCCIDGFLYHYMGPVFKRIEKETPGGSVKHLSAKVINSIQIPVPTLSEQKRIVGILDTFTASIDNLKEQIALRRKQYEYYRDQLLDLEGKEGVEMRTIKDICAHICSGGTPSTAHKEFYEGEIPWLRTQEIDWKYIYETGLRITEEAIAHSSAKMIPENCVIVAMYGATAAKVAINKIPLSTNQACCNLEIAPNKAVYKYVYYWLCKEYLNLKSMGEGSQNNINGKKVKDYPIPVPSISEQQRIVSILDTFEASIQNLEAQLAQREKQYEYYRNKLLTFE